MQYLAVREANYLKADSLYRRIPGIRADTLQFPLLQAYKIGDDERKRAILAAYDKSSTQAPVIGANALLRVMYEPEPFDRLVATALDNDLPDDAGKAARRSAARGLVEQGRMREAFDMAGTLTWETDPGAITWLTHGPFATVPRDRLLAWRNQIMGDSTETGTAPAQQLAQHLRLYNLAVVSCRLRDYPAASAYAQRLQQLPAPPQWAGAMRDLGTEAAAQVDLESGRVAEGLRKLESMKNYAPIDIGDLVRFNVPRLVWHAEALYRAGRYEDALRYFDHMDYAVGTALPNIAYRLLRMAQSHDALKNHDQAKLMYSQFLKLYEKADPEQQAIVTQVRNRLAALQQRSG